MALRDYTDIFKGRENPLTPEVAHVEAQDSSLSGALAEASGSNVRPDVVVDWVDITQRETSYGDRPIITLTAGFHQAKEEAEKFSEYALVLRRRIDKQRESIDVRIEINSDIIRTALQEVFAKYPFINVLAKPIIFMQPYYELFHMRKEIYEYAEAPERSEEERQHVAVLIKFMRLQLKNLTRMYDRLVPNGLISFEYLKTIFRPGILVIQQEDDIKSCYYMVDGNEATDDKDKQPVFRITGLSWEYDGTKFGAETHELKIPYFTGVRKIQQLDVFPLNLISEKDQVELRTYLTKRGHKWRDLVDVSHMQYDGVVDAADMGESKLRMTHVKGRVLLDYKTFYQERTNWHTNFAVSGQIIDVEQEVVDTPDPIEGTEDDGREEEDESQEKKKVAGSLDSDPILHEISKRYWNKPGYKLSEHQALLAPPKTPGFSFTDKIWGFFEVDKIEEIVWAEDAFGKLEIDLCRKDMIRILVQIHQKSQSTFDDIIAGKGKGLVFLLHGPPGGGKTLTAETISEHTRKPLYWVTSGELGTSPATADAVLSRVFRLATAWKAIVLLDEADVFLAKRTSNEIERNGFVSIFLRCLEWYQGILFLTTNRPEEFDDAFRSRIHMSLHYPPLDERQRTAIWRNLLRNRRVPADWDLATFQDFGKRYRLNGREIKNLISTALSIAEEDNRLLSRETIDLVYQINQLGITPDEGLQVGVAA